MPEVQDIQVVGDSRDESLRKITIFDYALHLISPFTMFSLTIIALIINYVKRGDARGSVYGGHMEYMISTCWWTLLWLVISSVVGFLSFGFLWFLTVIPAIWYMYRMIKGLLRAMDAQPINS